jgi:hypothetical protein
MRRARLSVAATLLGTATACGSAAPPPTTPAPASSSTPTPAAPPPSTPTPAPALDSPAWQPLAAAEAPCPGGDAYDRCLAITLPARGFVAVEGSSPHDHGCVELHGGVVTAAADDDGEVRLTMTLPGARPGPGLCHAFVSLHGRGVVGPLAAGAWLLRPREPLARTTSVYAPLHLDAVRFAAAP